MPVAIGMENRCRHDQDRGVYKEREHQGNSGIYDKKTNGLSLAFWTTVILTGLHNGRMQIKIVRHHRGSQNAHGYIEHLRIANDAGRRDKKMMGNFPPLWMGK